MILFQSKPPGICKARDKNPECTPISFLPVEFSEKLCESDNDCGGIEKCCNDGCYNMCTEDYIPVVERIGPPGPPGPPGEKVIV